jgi:hypothetical protein
VVAHSRMGRVHSDPLQKLLQSDVVVLSALARESGVSVESLTRWAAGYSRDRGGERALRWVLRELKGQIEKVLEAPVVGREKC